MKRSRAPVLDATKRREICAILAVGGTRAMAARYVGCAVSTIRRTAHRDPQFSQELERSVSHHEMQHLSSIQKAAGDARYWRAAVWALERRYPDRYGVRRPHVITAATLTAVLDELSRLVAQELTDPAARRRLLGRLRRLLRSIKLAEHGRTRTATTPSDP